MPTPGANFPGDYFSHSVAPVAEACRPSKHFEQLVTPKVLEYWPPLRRQIFLSDMEYILCYQALMRIAPLRTADMATCQMKRSRRAHNLLQWL
jgi:hypothetical protein